jgi:hypothetical protein
MNVKIFAETVHTEVSYVRFQVLTVASMMFRIVFWDVLPCKMIVDNNFTRQYIPEDNSEQEVSYFNFLDFIIQDACQNSKLTNVVNRVTTETREHDGSI